MYISLDRIIRNKSQLHYVKCNQITSDNEIESNESMYILSRRVRLKEN